jgi:hypothetical protein
MVYYRKDLLYLASSKNRSKTLFYSLNDESWSRKFMGIYVLLYQILRKLLKVFSRRLRSVFLKALNLLVKYFQKYNCRRHSSLEKAFDLNAQVSKIDLR